MSEDDLKEILKHDYYGDAQTCLEKGLVDEIL
jgi:ATP-dependent protease ClpP protease subunit